MADCVPYEDLFQTNDNVTDLHAYYMSQFNLELENGNKTKSKIENFKCGVEESFDFEVIDWNNSGDTNGNNDFEIIDQIIDSDINEDNIKEVLLDLDSIEFENKDNCKTEFEINNTELETNFYEPNNEYIDDESLIDELCREDSESQLSPNYINEDYLLPANNITLPSIQTAFSNRYCNYNAPNNEENAYHYNNTTTEVTRTNTQVVKSLECYSYPNNILHNLENGKSYVLPDTPTSVTEFSFDRNERKASVSESIESDVQSSSYSETLDDDELFINLDDFGFTFDKDNECLGYDEQRNIEYEKKSDKDKVQVSGERVCLWEHCYEKYPNQNSLVEHIERCHVNSYKGDEFSCLWRDCIRSRRPFNARYKLLIHMRVHSGHKPNRCHHPGCGKAFSRLENLKIHVRSHTGERPYACLAPHCRKAFSNSSDRAKHQRTHFNARPYACGAVGCGKRYTDPSSLRKHVKSHPHASVPRTCVPPPRPIRRPDPEQRVPSSPAKLATLRSIRDKLILPKLNRI